MRFLRPASPLLPALALVAAVLVGLGVAVGGAFELSNRCRFDCGVFAHLELQTTALLAPVVTPVAALGALAAVGVRGAATPRVAWGLAALAWVVVVDVGAWIGG